MTNCIIAGMSSDEATRYLERQRQAASSVVTASNTHRRALREGEWACVDAKCAYINADRVTVCERCGKAKPRSKNRVGREIGKDAAEKSKGLFAAEDWACTKFVPQFLPVLKIFPGTE